MHSFCAKYASHFLPLSITFLTAEIHDMLPTAQKLCWIKWKPKRAALPGNMLQLSFGAINNWSLLS